MDITLCACGSLATHRCSACKPYSALCLECIEDHLSLRPEDGLISLKNKQNFKDPSLNCHICKQAGPELLQIDYKSAAPICIPCK